MTPGSRWFNGRIALNRCVNIRAPASMPALASSRVALVWPMETTTSRAVEAANRVDCAGQLGRERDQSKRAHREHSLEGVAARLEIERRMRAEAERRNERTFEMHPENRGGIGGVVAREFSIRARDRLVNLRDLFDRRGDRGRHPGGRAFAREMTAQSGECVGRRVHHVDTVRAVDLQIDEAGQDVIVAAVGRGLERGDPIGERDAARERVEPSGFAMRPDSFNSRRIARRADARSAAGRSGRRFLPCPGTSQPRRP